MIATEQSRVDFFMEANRKHLQGLEPSAIAWWIDANPVLQEEEKKEIWQRMVREGVPGLSEPDLELEAENMPAWVDWRQIFHLYKLADTLREYHIGVRSLTERKDLLNKRQYEYIHISAFTIDGHDYASFYARITQEGPYRRMAVRFGFIEPVQFFTF